VEVGYCNSCKRQSSGIVIPSKKSILGENVRKYVCILSIANRMYHNQSKKNIKQLRAGRLGDVAPTILKIMNVKKPKEMAGKELF